MSKARSSSKPAGLSIIHPFAARIDIGSRFHVAAVSPDLCDEPVPTFQAFTSDLERMADLLVATGSGPFTLPLSGNSFALTYDDKHGSRTCHIF